VVRKGLWRENLQQTIRRGRVQPVGPPCRFFMADSTDGLVAGAEAAEHRQVGSGVGEGPTGADPPQFAGLRTDKAAQAEAWYRATLQEEAVGILRYSKEMRATLVSERIAASMIA
jgi:hypothetical protein